MNWEWFLFFLTATTKWSVAAAWTLVSNALFMPVVIVASGGFAGILLYTFFGEKLSQWLKKFKKPKPFKMNKRKRTLVKIKRDYGLAGISFLTPVLLSIPVGCMLCFAITDDKFKIIRFQTASLGLWVLIVLAVKLVR